MPAADCRLIVDFQGVIALVPELPFDQGPSYVDVLLRDLREPGILFDELERPHAVGSHVAWLEWEPSDQVASHKEPKGIFRYEDPITRLDRRLLPLQRQHVRLRIDGEEPAPSPIVIDPQLLDQLPVYRGQLKPDFQPNASGSAAIAAALRISGGELTVSELTTMRYELPSRGGGTVVGRAATAVRWEILFQKRVELLFVPSPTTPILKFQPSSAADDVHLVFRNRELEQLITGSGSGAGGLDDPEFMVYGDMIQAGTPRVLISHDQATPAGKRACGLAAIEG